MKSKIVLYFFILLVFLIMNVNTFCAEGREILKFQPIGKTWEEILPLVQSSGKTGLLYFTLKGCGPCKALEDSVFHNEEAIKYIESNYISFWIESINSAGNALSKKFNVSGTPTVVLINKSGEVINKVVGYGGTSKEYIKRLEASVSPDSSLGALKAVLEKDPGNVEVAKKYAYKLWQSKEIDEAIKQYEKIIIKVSDAEVFSNLAYCYERNNNVPKAVEILEKGLEQNVFGDETDLINCRAGNLLIDIQLPIDLRQYAKALQYYKKLPLRAEDFKTFNKSPNDKQMIQYLFMQSQKNISFVYLKTGQEQVGKDMLNEKFSKAYEKKDFYTIASLLSACTNHETYLQEAIPWVEKANKLSGGKDFSLLLFSAMLLQKAGEYNKAIEVQEKLLVVLKAMGGDTQWPLRYLAVMYLQAGNNQKADSLFNTLVDSAGNDFWKYHNLSSACLRNDVNYQKALGWAEKAIELSKTKYARESEGARDLDLFPGLLLDNYAGLLFKTGQIQKAIEVETQAINMSLDENSRNQYRVNIEKYKMGLK